MPLARVLASGLLLFSAAAFAQDAPVPTIRTGTQLVILDVVVQDRNGNPVHGLSRSDFTVLEQKHPQTVRNFEEHTTANPPKPGPTLPPMPPGTFTDYTPTPPSGTLNILLLDALNTPMSDQAYVRYQLQQYVKKAQPGTRVAIFGLSHRLFMLQGFTSDPSTLRDVVEHKLIPRGSPLLDDPAGSGVDTEQLSDLTADMGPSMAQVTSNLQQFEAETQAFQTQLRIQYTLAAFNVLAHYLSAFPGRKNLIWFSGSFPVDILPDPTLDNAFSVMEQNDEQFRETTNLLARAQVAVYPVDARGLMTAPMYSAANSGHSYARNPQAFGAAQAKFAQSQAQEHMTMEQLAEDTGGHAFFNTNDLASAVTKAIDAGSNFYTLTYTPTDRNWKGEYRDIRISLSPALEAAKYKLSYRHGYYADDPEKPRTPLAATTTTGAVESAAHGNTYAQAAMSHGAPTPQELLFKVRILPAATGTEATLPEGNTTDPLHPLKPPFKRFAVDFAALTSGIQLNDAPQGRHTGGIEFSAFLFDPDGRLLNATGRTVSLDLSPATYKQFQHGVASMHLEIGAPLKGESYLRVGVHDTVSNRFGVVEIPLSSVARLPPPPSRPAPPAGTPASPAPAPAAQPATSAQPAPSAQPATSAQPAPAAASAPPPRQ